MAAGRRGPAGSGDVTSSGTRPSRRRPGELRRGPDGDLRCRAGAVPYPAADHAFLRRLASALAAQGPPVTLVIDDLHVLTEPTVRDELDFVLRNAGPGLRVVISARADPLLPLHRYRLAGELAEIRAGDLA